LASLTSLPLSTYTPNFTYQIEQDDALDAMAAGMVYDVSPSKEILKVQKQHKDYFERQFQLSGL